MKDYVLTIKDDVCAANGKDVEAVNLLETMKLWGEVKPLDTVLASVRAEYQAVIDNLTNQLNAIKEQELTTDEIIFLNFYRARKIENSAVFQERIDSLEKELVDSAAAFRRKAEQISQVLSQG